MKITIDMKQCVLSMGILLSLLFTGCKKGELTSSTYYGKIRIIMGELPGSSPVDAYIDGKKIAEIYPGTGSAATPFVVTAGKVMLTIFKLNTDSLVADSSIVIPENQLVEVQIRNSTVFGGGFINTRPVTADSIAYQIYSEWDNFLNPGNGVNMIFGPIDWNTGEPDYKYTAYNVEKGKLHPEVFTLPFTDQDGNQFFYLGQFVDAITGEVLVPPSGYPYINFTADAGGAFYIVKIDDQGGSYGVSLTAL